MWNLQKAFSLRTIKICRFEIIDGVKYVYCIKHAYNFFLREQVGFVAVLWRLRQGVSCLLMLWVHHCWNVNINVSENTKNKVGLVEGKSTFGMGVNLSSINMYLTINTVVTWFIILNKVRGRSTPGLQQTKVTLC